VQRWRADPANAAASDGRMEELHPAPAYPSSRRNSLVFADVPF